MQKKQPFRFQNAEVFQECFKFMPGSPDFPLKHNPVPCQLFIL